MNATKTCLLPLLTAALILSSCTKDEIETTENSGGGGVNNETSLTDPALAWSVTSFEAVYGETTDFPTLDNPYGVAVRYASSDSSVAAIDSASGSITLIGVGETTISATSEATSVYSFGKASYTLTVTVPETSLESAGIAWSAGAYTATLEASDNAFPTLSNPHGLAVSYASSDTSIATIAADGSITLLKIGTATIIATSAATETYAAGSASYTLSVISSTDTGAGTYTFPSSGDPASEDDIANSSFQRRITLTWNGSSVSVEGDARGFVSVSGAHVTVNNTSDECIVYRLGGSATNGSFKLYSSRKQVLLLDGLQLTNPSGAAINNQSRKRTFVIVEGSNSLADGSSAAYSTSSSEDCKAVFFSEGQLVFSGSGSLSVNAGNAKGKAGITSDDYVRFMASPTVKVVSGSSAGHGVRGKDAIKVSDGRIDVSVAAAMKKGFSTDSLARFDGGITTITVTGGSGKDDDGDYSSSAGIKADLLFEMTGGTVSITNSGAGGKGIRVGSSYDSSNPVYLGTSYMSGGTLTVKTTGSYYSAGDKNPKGIKIGWAEKSSSGGGGGWPGGGGGGGGHTTYTDMTGDFEMRGGVMVVSSAKAEAIEIKKTLTVSGGEMYGYSTGDDAINTASTFTVTGGLLCGISSANDGLDANGNFYIKGGVVYAVGKSSPELAIDANTEGGFKLYVSGGTLFTIGGLESGASLTQTCYQSSSWSKNTWYSITVGDATYAFKTPSSGGSKLVVSGASKPAVKSGVSVTGGTAIFDGMGYSDAVVSGGSSVNLSSYSGGGGGGPGW